MTVVATFILHLLYARAGFLFRLYWQPFPPQSALYSAESQRLSKNIWLVFPQLASSSQT